MKNLFCAIVLTVGILAVIYGVKLGYEVRNKLETRMTTINEVIERVK